MGEDQPVNTERTGILPCLIATLRCKLSLVPICSILYQLHDLITEDAAYLPSPSTLSDFMTACMNF